MGDGAISEGRESQDSALSENSLLRGRVDSFCQSAILVIVLAILVWAPLAMAAVRLVDFVPVEVLTALALGLWVVRFWSQRPFRLFWPPVCWGVYAFVFYALARCQVVPIPYLAQRELTEVVVYAVLFVVIINNLNRRESAEIVSVTLLTLGMALSLFAVYQFTTHSPRVSWLSWAHKTDQYIRRGSGTFINPDNFAGFVEMLIPLGLSYVILSRMSATAKVLLGYATVVMIAGVCASVSRGAMGATAVATVLLCVSLVIEGGYMLPSILALVILCGGAIAVRENIESVERRFTKAEEQARMGDERIFYWKVAEDIFDDHKLWGAGPAQFDQEFYQYRPVRAQVRIRYAHNEYLNTLADWGIAGLTIIAAFAGSVLYGAFRTWRGVRRKSDLGSRQSDKLAFVVGSTFGLLALLLHCLIDFDMHIPADALLAVALMGLLVAHWRFVTERHWKNPGSTGKIALAAAAVGAMAFLGVRACQQGVEQHWFESAKAQLRILNQPIDPDSPDYEAAAHSPARQNAFQEEIADLQKAYDGDPSDAEVSFALGEAYWGIAAQGNTGYQRYTLMAMPWYSRSILANPFNALAWLQYGMCLDWLDRHHEADAYFNRAGSLDPNGWYVTFYRARHLVEMNKIAEAREMFLQACQRNWDDPKLYAYVRLMDERLAAGHR